MGDFLTFRYTIILASTLLLVYFIFSLKSAIAHGKKSIQTRVPIIFLTDKRFEFLIKSSIVISFLGSLYLFYLVFFTKTQLLVVYQKVINTGFSKTMSHIFAINLKSEFFWPLFPLYLIAFTIIFFSYRFTKNRIIKPLGLWEDSHFQISKNLLMPTTFYWIFEFFLKSCISISILGSIYLGYLLILRNQNLLRIYKIASQLNYEQIKYLMDYKSIFFWSVFPIIFVASLFILYFARITRNRVNLFPKAIKKRSKRVSRTQRKPLLKNSTSNIKKRILKLIGKIKESSISEIKKQKSTNQANKSFTQTKNISNSKSDKIIKKFSAVLEYEKSKIKELDNDYTANGTASQKKEWIEFKNKLNSQTKRFEQKIRDKNFTPHELDTLEKTSIDIMDILGKLKGPGQQSTRSYSSSLSVDGFNGRVTKIGSEYVFYNNLEQMDRVGHSAVTYDNDGRIYQIGSWAVSYDNAGRLYQIGSMAVIYNSYDNRVAQIGSNYVFYE